MCIGARAPTAYATWATSQVPTRAGPLPRQKGEVTTLFGSHRRASVVRTAPSSNRRHRSMLLTKRAIVTRISALTLELRTDKFIKIGRCARGSLRNP